MRVVNNCQARAQDNAVGEDVVLIRRILIGLNVALSNRRDTRDGVLDVQGALLYYVVCAWEYNFTGYIIDYGTFPDQQRQYFTLRDVRTTLAIATKVSGMEAQIYAGLETLVRKLLAHSWKRQGEMAFRIERCLIDANWRQSTDVVYQFCRQSEFASVIMPSHGKLLARQAIH